MTAMSDTPAVSSGNLGCESVLPSRTGFCRLAAVYSTLERLAFGPRLEQARFCHLDYLRDCRDILLLGEGDGRCLARLAQMAPNARLHMVDSSPGMLQRAVTRLDELTQRRVTFIPADVTSWQPPAQAYDAVVTVFFLDCLVEEQVRSLVNKLQPALRPGARWVWADFVLPSQSIKRLRARFWLRIIYGFFNYAAGLQARALPPTEEILATAGWQPLATREFQDIFARSVVFSQPGCVS